MPKLLASTGPHATNIRARRQDEMALYLFDAYSHTLSPAAAPSYAREVLDEAYPEPSVPTGSACSSSPTLAPNAPLSAAT